MKSTSLILLLAAAGCNASPDFHALDSGDGSKIPRRYLFLESRKSGKGNKGSKSRKSSSPTTSTMPSKLPSSAPSFFPSVSSRPSALPSSMPTSNPSRWPSDIPSVFPTLSTMPSSSPTSKPTSVPTSPPTLNPSALPSTKPSDFPSSSPSFKPSSFPTVQPTMIPSFLPSTQPSDSPSVSNAPSTIPSESPTSSPTINTIVGLKSVENGIQEGCPVPSYLDDSNFAQDSVQNVTASFVYALTLKIGTDEETAIEEIQVDFHRFVFNKYLNCEGKNQPKTQVRSTNAQEWEYHENKNNPIGTTTLPKDVHATDMECQNTKKNEKCIPLDGKITLLYTDVAEIPVFEEETNVLTAIKDAIKSGQLEISNPNITALEYYGKRGTLSDSREGFFVPRPVDQRVNETRNISVSGAAIISASIIAVALAFFAGKSKWRNAQFKRNNAAALAVLNREQTEDIYDLFELKSENSGTFSRSSQSQIRDTRKLGMPFPLGLPGIKARRSKSEPSDDDNLHLAEHFNAAPYQTQKIPPSISSLWYEDIEVDFSENKNYRSFSVNGDTVSL